MSDAAPPDWFDNGPPPEAYDLPAGPASAGQRGGGGKRQRPAMSQDETLAATTDFLTWLSSRETRAELQLVLPDHVDPDIFIATAKTAVLNRPELLRDDLRPSLLRAIERAATQGLRPDGKEGALVARWDTEANRFQICWQPMVWGITKLGRETGAIRTIRAVIVFHGEPFRIIQGDEDRIEHEVQPDIVEEAYRALNAGRDNHGNPIARPNDFLARVRAAYCVITGTDGAVTKRWMTRERLISLRDASKSAKGPWNSRWIDEMICKGVILFTSKWINLDTSSAPAKRFLAALTTDMEVDFDRDHAVPPPPPVSALPAPGPKLDNLEDLLGREREKMPVGGTVPAGIQEDGGFGGPSTSAAPPPTEPRDNHPGACAAPPLGAPVEASGGVEEAGGPGHVSGSPAPNPMAPPSADPRDKPGACSAGPASAADQGSAETPGGGAQTPPGATLQQRVDAALREIASRPSDAVARMTAGRNYCAFVKELTDAGATNLLELLASAVQQKAAQPTETENLALSDIRSTKSWTALGELERNAAFKSRVAALPPAARSRVATAIRDQYGSFGPGGDYGP